MGSPSSASPGSLHARMDPASIAAKPHNLSTSPPPPGSPMPPAASLAARTEEASSSTSPSPSSATPASAIPSTSSQPAPPPEVEATLSKLTSHKNVTGCLILSRPDALIIRAGGRDFEPSGPGAHDRSERLRRVVKLVRQTMETLSSGVGEVDEGDDLGFVRIRTTRYEMMISPSERYILVVLSDPNVSP